MVGCSLGELLFGVGFSRSTADGARGYLRGLHLVRLLRHRSADLLWKKAIYQIVSEVVEIVFCCILRFNDITWTASS